MTAKTPRRQARASLDPASVERAFDRLARRRAFHTLVRGALSTALLKRLLKDALPRSAARAVPPEVWSSLAVGIALESPVFRMPLAEALHDALAWDREPAGMDEWWRAVRERPLEALWMAALSDAKTLRKEFAHVAEHCVENWRESPDCPPPSWEYVEGLLDVQALSIGDLRQAEKHAEDAERRAGAEGERLSELREDLKRARRELAELRGGKAEAERRIEALKEHAPALDDGDAGARIEELERRLRKSEKEREHLHRELARLEAAASAPLQPDPSAAVAEAAAIAAVVEEAEEATPLASDPNPRRRVLRQILRKLVKKGKIGASHTHEDNVYRGVADHEKGIAKEAIELLYREGFLVPKPTATDPHVSVAPERLAEVRAIVAGEIGSPRLLKFIEP
jgi:hypothetical protein